MTLLVVVIAALLWPGRDPRPRSALTRSVPALPRRTQTVSPEEAASLAELLAMALRSGGARHRAVEVVRPDAPEVVRALLDELAAELAAGRAGGQVWGRWAEEHPSLDPCASAWRLSEECGVALAPALEQAARSARARAAAAQRLQAASAGARATMLLLTVLPAVGLLAAWTLGVSPARIVTESPAATVSVALGAALTALGWGTSRLILSRAVRPGTS